MRTVSTFLACVVALGTVTLAQQKPQAAPQEKPSSASSAPAEGPRRLVPLKVQIVLSRFKGEKKIGSLPYLLSVAANDRAVTNLRMGIDVPISNRSQGYNYRSVGTNIDCFAETAPGDSYKLNVTVEDSSIHLDAAKPSEPAAPSPTYPADVPMFRTFKTNFALLLRDGQTGQYTSAVDPISGEVMKVDVSLNIMK